MWNKYPYINYNDLNLDFILRALREMEHKVNDFVSLNAIKYANPIQWSINRQYEKNTIVIDPLTGTAFISVQPVPSGIALTRTQYWTVVFDLGSFVTRAAQNFTDNWESETTTTATFSTTAGEWLVWGDVLYKTLVNITAGDTYVVNSNIKHITIEDIYGEYINTITHILDDVIGDLGDLDTADSSSIVDAINSVVNDSIGDLSTLTTRANSTVVESINSLATSRNEIVVNVKDFGAVGDGVTDDLEAINAAIEYLKPTGGTIYFPAGSYGISAPIHIGDGTARTTMGTIDSSVSSYNSIKLVGVGCERVGLPRATSITPLTSMTSAIYVDGRICNVEISKMILWLNGNTQYGLYICSTSHSKFTDIYIYNPTEVGMVVMGGALPTGNYNTFNTFERIHVVLNTSNTIGLLMDGVIIRDNVPVNNDSWISTFIDCRFQTQPSITGCRAAQFKYVDNITFIRCHFGGAATSMIGVEFNALSSAPSNPFPMGLSFIDCSIKNYTIVEDPDRGLYVGKQYVIGAGVNDLENLPRNDKIFGFDANGRLIGGFGCTKVEQYSDLISAASTLPAGYAITIMCSPTFVNTYIGYSAYCAGYAQRLTDTLLQLNLIGNEGEYFVIFDLTTATRVTWGKVGSRPELTTIAELSAINGLLHNGDSTPCSFLPAFISTYFGDTVTETSYGVLQRTNSTLATAFAYNNDTIYYINFDPTSNTVITSGKNLPIPYKRFESMSDLTNACVTLSHGHTILFECNADVTTALVGVSTQSQGSIIYVGGGAVQVELSNNVGYYYARVKVSDGSILQSGYLTFTQNT